jgi:hypothetical protein
MPDLPEVSSRRFTPPPAYRGGNFYRDYESSYRPDVLKELRETRDRLEVIRTTDVFVRPRGSEEPWAYAYSSRRRQRSKKCLCVGGPLDGTMAVIGTPDYTSYTRAFPHRRSGLEVPSTILVYTHMLPVSMGN